MSSLPELMPYVPLPADRPGHVHAGVTVAHEQEQPGLAGGTVARRALGFGGAVVLRARFDVVPVSHHPAALTVGLNVNGRHVRWCQHR